MMSSSFSQYLNEKRPDSALPNANVPALASETLARRQAAVAGRAVRTAFESLFPPADLQAYRLRGAQIRALAASLPPERAAGLHEFNYNLLKAGSRAHEIKFASDWGKPYVDEPVCAPAASVRMLHALPLCAA